jgi:hypothetical protein
MKCRRYTPEPCANLGPLNRRRQVQVSHHLFHDTISCQKHEETRSSIYSRHMDLSIDVGPGWLVFDRNGCGEIRRRGEKECCARALCTCRYKFSSCLASAGRCITVTMYSPWGFAPMSRGSDSSHVHGYPATHHDLGMILIMTRSAHMSSPPACPPCSLAHQPVELGHVRGAGDA